MRRLLPSLVAVGLSSSAAPAAADRVEAFRGAALELQRPTMTARHERGLVHVTMGYEVVNPTERADEATVRLEVPQGGVVTGMRYRMSPGLPWLEGRLMAAEAAAEEYDAYASAPFVSARGAAWLAFDGHAGTLSLSYVPARGRVGVAYDVAVPACFAHGRWLVAMPPFDAAPRMQVQGGQVMTAKQVQRALGTSVEEACARFHEAGAVPEGDQYVVFADAPRGIEATMTTVTAVETQVSALEVVTPATLAPAPRGAAVVFVIDASRSMDDEGIAAQLAVVRGYLAHVPDARVEIVMVRRRAARLFGAWVPADEVDARLAALAPSAIAPGNGSHLDVGIAVAGDLLAGVTGPRRMVAFTDDRLRVAIEGPQIEAAMARLPEDAIAHVALLWGDVGTSWVTREWEHRFAPAAMARGGIVARVEGGTDPAPFLELVRPVRIEGVQAVYPLAPDAPEEAIARVEELEVIAEGTGLRAMYVGEAPAVHGWIWGRRWQPATPRTRVATTRVARLALGTVGGQLDDGAVGVLAALGTVATRVTSFFADDPRWRPGGLPDDELGLSGGSYASSCGWPSGMHGVGRYGTIGRGAGTGTGIVPEMPELGPLLEARVAACAAPLGAPWSTAVAIETTGVEIVDVTVTTTAPDLSAVARARFDGCVTDAAWDLMLDPRFGRYTKVFAATFGG